MYKYIIHTHIYVCVYAHMHVYINNFQLTNPFCLLWKKLIKSTKCVIDFL